MRSLTISIAVAITLALTPGIASAADLHVEASGTDSPTCGPLGNECQTIAQATTNAVSGDRVLIGDGTFVQTARINPGAKSIEYIGNGAANTTVTANSANFGSGNAGLFAFRTDGATVAVRNLTVTGFPSTAPTGNRFGIWIQPAGNNPLYSIDATIENVNFVGIGPAPAGVYENAVYAGYGNNDLTIDNCTFTDDASNNILLEKQRGPVTITNSTFTPPASAQGTVIFSMLYGSGGLNWDQAGAYNISNNTFNAATAMSINSGFSTLPVAAMPIGVTIANNTINPTASSGSGISLRNNSLTSGGADGQIDNVQITGNTIVGGSSNGTGIRLSGNIADAQITSNNVRDRSIGVFLSRAYDHFPTGAVVSANQLVDNTAGVNLDSDPGTPAAPPNPAIPQFASDANLSGNWWGCNEGPAIGPAPPNADCDTIATNDASAMTLSDWVVLGIGATPGSTLAYQGSATVTAGFDKLNTNAAAPSGVFADGTVLPLTPTMGNLANANPTLTSAVASTSFTSYWRTGRSVSASFDHETVTQNWATDPTPLTLHVETPSNGGLDSPTCGPLPHGPCATIAQANANSLSGDTILVGAGTFPVTTCVSITHDLTITGDGVGSTILDGQSSTALGCDGMLRPSGDGTTISISGMTFQNLAAKSPSSSAAFAIFAVPTTAYDAVDVNVSDIEVLGAAAAKSPCAFSSSNNSGDVTVDNLTWPSASGNTIMLQNHTGDSLIENSTITQSATSVAIFDYSWGGGPKTVTGDHIYRNNTINAANGVYVNAGFSYTPSLAPSSYLGDVIFDGNTINSTGSSVYGIRIANTPQATPSPPNPITSPATIDNVKMFDNVFTGAGSGSGVSLQGKVNTADIHNNSIRGYARGLDLVSSPVFAADYPSDAAVHANQIVDNTTGVRLAASTYAIPADLSSNWWGCNAGPTVASAPPAADCDSVTTDDDSQLTLDDWVVLRMTATPASALPSAGSAATNAGFDQLNTGDPAPSIFADGTILPMSSTGGTLASASPTLTSSMTGNTFTSTAAVGRSASATFDHQTVTQNWADDVTPPVVTITAPLDNAFLGSSPVTVNYTFTDFGGGVTCNLANGASVALTPGANSIVVSCTDAAGNVGIDSVAVTYDPNDPVVTILSPPNGSITNAANTNVFFSATDATATTCDRTNGATQALVEGPNTITVTCTDAAGNSGSDSISVTRDTIPPSILITSPIDGSSTLDATATLHYSVVDATATSCTPNDGDAIALSYGANTITVSCTDAAGNTATSSITVTRTSNVPPVVTITSPTPGLVIDGDKATLTYNAASQHGTVSCTPPSGSVLPLAIGVNTLTVNCVDNFGNVASASVTVYRPDTLPECARSVMITDVKRVGSRTRITGLARLQYVGKRVGIEYQPTGSKKVGNPKIAPDGSFSVVVNRPSRPSINSNKARYRAVLGRTKTSWIKLTRRMGASAVTYNDNGTLTVTGSVSLPIAKGQPVRVERSDACGKYRQIGSVKMDRDGTFAGNVPSGGPSQGAVNIRIRARVAKSSNPRYRFNTYSIVQPVIIKR